MGGSRDQAIDDRQSLIRMGLGQLQLCTRAPDEPLCHRLARCLRAKHLVEYHFRACTIALCNARRSKERRGTTEQEQRTACLCQGKGTLQVLLGGWQHQQLKREDTQEQVAGSHPGPCSISIAIFSPVSALDKARPYSP